MHWYFDAITKFFVFEGRMSRNQYFEFFIYNFSIYSTFICLDALCNHVEIDFILSGAEPRYAMMSGPYSWFTLVPFITATIRRLHDINKSMISLSIVFVPWIGSILLFFVLCKDGDKVNNKYGSDQRYLNM